MDVRSRARGCLLGGAIGDALGAPVEFDSIDDIRRRYGRSGIGGFAPAYGSLGAVTDDTQMTLFTAEALVRAAHRLESGDAGAGLIVAELHAAYLRWLSTQEDTNAAARDGLVDLPALHARRAPGTTCLGALRSGRSGSVKAPLNDSKGCGGVMRVAPVGLVCADPFAVAVDAAAITHGHPSGYLSAGAFAVMIGVLMDGATMAEAVDAGRARVAAAPDAGEVAAALDAAVALARRRSIEAEDLGTLGGGWTGEEALAIAACTALVAENDAAAALRLAVNHSGDSDSTGSLCGNLVGTRLGEEALPADLAGAVELRDVVRRMADDLASVRPLEGHRRQEG
jgi:ADP-ribosylglycohydrolase